MEELKVPKEMEEEIQDFFEDKTSREIIAARQWLEKESEGFQTNPPALFVAACLAHILHGNRPYALSRRSHNIIPIPPKGHPGHSAVGWLR